MANSADPALVVFAWGNVSRGDDGIGPAMARNLRELAHPHILVIEDHQLNIEHVTDIRERTPALFIDASIAIDQDFGVERLVPTDDGNFSTHAISPAALLNVYCNTMQKPAPDAFLLHIAGRNFELGDGLSTAAQRAVKAAYAFLGKTFDEPSSEWCARFMQAATPAPYIMPGATV